MPIQRNSETRPAVDEIDDYSDLTVLDVNFTYDFDEVNTADNAGQDTASASYELGIDKHEVAELIRIDPKVEIALHLHEGGALAEPAALQADWELYRAPSNVFSQLVNADQSGAENAASFKTGYFQGGEANDLLYQTSVTDYSMFEDETNGTAGGGGSAAALHPDVRDFREPFGRGPMFQHDQNLHLGLNVQWWNNTGVRFRIKGGYRAYFDTFELEKPRLIESRN